MRRALISAGKVATLLRTSPLMFPIDNLYERGVVAKQKTFKVSPAPSTVPISLRKP